MFCWKRTVQTILFPDNNQFKMKKHPTPMIPNRTASDGEIIGLIKQRILSIPDPEILEDAEKWTKIIQLKETDLLHPEGSPPILDYFLQQHLHLLHFFSVPA